MNNLKTKGESFLKKVSVKTKPGRIITSNKNIIENATSLSADGDRNSITGNIKLIRNSSGKVITSQQKTVRIALPTDTNNLKTLGLTAAGTETVNNEVELTINSKNS